MNIDLTSIFLGWLLGILSPIVVTKILRKYEKRDLHIGIKNELKDFQFRMICSSHKLCGKYGNFTREYIDWLFEVSKNHSNHEKFKTITDGWKVYNELTDEQLNQYLDNLRANLPDGLSLKKYSLAFTEMTISDLAVFRSNFLLPLLDLRTRISFMNDEIDKISKMHFMTFDSSISSLNHSILKHELYRKYSDLQDTTDSIVNKIEELLDNKKF